MCFDPIIWVYRPSQVYRGNIVLELASLNSLLLQSPDWKNDCCIVSLLSALLWAPHLLVL